MKVAGVDIEPTGSEFKILFEKLFPSMVVFATRILGDEDKAKDVTQDAFIKIWQKTDEDFADENALKAYLYVLVKNACISLIRKESRVGLDDIDQHGNIPSEKIILDEILREETYQMLASSINTLSPQAQQVVNLALKGLTNPEIAEHLNVSVNTVKTVKKRAYKALRDLLGYQFVSIILTQLISFFK